MTHAEQKAALLRAVALEPESVTPRLILADWLEEYGSAAEREAVPFIRAEYAPADIQISPRTRTVRLWNRHAASLLSGLVPKSYALWLNAWPDPRPLFTGPDNTFPAQYGNTGLACTRPVIVVTLRHGFVENVSAPVRWFRKNAGRLFASQPVRCVVLHSPQWCPGWEADTNFFTRGRPADWNREREFRLPPELFDRLLAPRASGATTRVPDGAAVYPGEYSPQVRSLAYNDLSQAIVSWGRCQAEMLTRSDTQRPRGPTPERYPTPPPLKG